MEQSADWNDLSPSEKAESLAEQGAEAIRNGLEQAAYSYYVQSLNLYRGLDDKPSIVRILRRLSYLAGWADFGDGRDMFARRQILAAEAIPLAREVGDAALLAKTLCTFSSAMGPDKTKAILQESMALAEASGDKEALAGALSRLAGHTALIELSDGGEEEPECSQALNKRALHLYEDLGDKAGMAGILFSLAIHAEKEQKHAYLERALELQRSLGAKRRIYEILTLLANTCDPQDLDRREAYLQEALELTRQFGNTLGESSCLGYLAKIARQRGDTTLAKALEAESKRVHPEPKSRPNLREMFMQLTGKAPKSSSGL